MRATVNNIKEIIKQAEIVQSEEELHSELSLSEQGVDSLDSVNIYLLIEEKFNIKIPDTDLDRVQTIDNIVEYVNKKLSCQ